MNGKSFVFLITGVFLLAGLFLFFRPKHDVAPAGTGAAVSGEPAPAANTAYVPPDPKRFAIVVKGGRVDGPGTMKVSQDEQVIISVTSDKAEEVHLHGYELVLMLDPNIASELRFRADKSGHFELEAHKHHAELGALEVQPKQ